MVFERKRDKSLRVQGEKPPPGPGCGFAGYIARLGVSGERGNAALPVFVGRDDNGRFTRWRGMRRGLRSPLHDDGPGAVSSVLSGGEHAAQHPQTTRGQP